MTDAPLDLRALAHSVEYDCFGREDNEHTQACNRIHAALVRVHAAGAEEKCKQHWGNPCEKHEKVAAWVAKVKKDDEGLHCFGCFIVARETAAHAAGWRGGAEAQRGQCAAAWPEEEDWIATILLREPLVPPPEEP